MNIRLRFFKYKGSRPGTGIENYPGLHPGHLPLYG